MESTTFTVEMPKPKGWKPTNKQSKKFILFSVMRWLFIKKHKWKYTKNKLRRECLKCGEKQIVVDYNGFYYTYEIINY
jgi:hypothetical protein